MIISSQLNCVTNLEVEKMSYPVSSSERNTRLAQEAIAYTTRALSKGASNVVNNKVSDAEIVEMRTDATMRQTAAAISVWAACTFIALTISIYIFPVVDPVFSGLVLSPVIYKTLGRPVLIESICGIESRVAKSYQMGNCGEHARIAFDYLKQIGVRVELVSDFANDHCFVVIDKDPKSSSADPREWGAHAVVCDPWARQCFPASELKKRLAHILFTHSRLPIDHLEKEDFRLLNSSDNNQIFSCIGGGLSNALCLDILVLESLKSS